MRAADGWVRTGKLAFSRLMVGSVSSTGSPHPPLTPTVGTLSKPRKEKICFVQNVVICYLFALARPSRKKITQKDISDLVEVPEYILRSNYKELLKNHNLAKL